MAPFWLPVVTHPITVVFTVLSIALFFPIAFVITVCLAFIIDRSIEAGKKVLDPTGDPKPKDEPEVVDFMHQAKPKEQSHVSFGKSFGSSTSGKSILTATGPGGFKPLALNK